MKLASVVLRRVATACALAAAIAALGAASASALLVHLRNGHTLSFERLHGHVPGAALRTSSTAKLVYHGGPIMPSNTNYAVYWDPEGAPAYPAEYESGLDLFFEDLAHDSGGDQNVDSVATQYGDSAGEVANYSSHFGGALLDTDAYPASGCTAAPKCFTDAQLQAELTSYVIAHGLPHDLTHEYFMLTPPGVESCFEATGSICSAGSTSPVYCAYHSSISLTGGPLIYADDPFVTGVFGCDDGEHPNEKPSDGALEGGLSHEHNESITDPEGNAWYGGPEGEENGDKCRTFAESSEYGTPLGTAPDGSRYNQVINSHLYWYQQEWSNEGSKCLQRLAPGTPAVTKISPLSGPAGGGTTVTITGTSLSGATAVKFGAVGATSFKVLSSTSLTAIAPAEPAGLVNVTVTTPGGTSEISLKDRYKFTPSVSAVSPNSGPAAGGTVVKITGKGFSPGTGTTAFKFGATLAKNVSCSSSEECTAIAPKHEAGTVDVFALVNKVKSAAAAGDKFTYA
jgi:IPT/TIG domain